MARCLANSTAFAGRPTGDSPEMMPLDCSLNKDVDDAVKRHVWWTKTIADPDHPVKFDRSSLKKHTAAYLRLLDPSQPLVVKNYLRRALGYIG